MSAEPVPCVVLGGGGHARVVIEALQAGGAATPIAVLDANRALWGTKILGVPVLGGDERLPHVVQQQVRHFVVGLGGVGDNQPRRRLFDHAVASGLRPLTVCHPSAIRSPSAAIGEGTVLFPGSVVNAGVRLGLNVIVNTGAIVEHDCVVGDHAHLASGAILASAVKVGAFAHIGAGVTVRQGLFIGAGALVGAGAVVVKDVDPWVVVVGVPAHPLRGGRAPAGAAFRGRFDSGRSAAPPRFPTPSRMERRFESARRPRTRGKRT